jgi:hypothetical protein
VDSDASEPGTLLGGLAAWAALARRRRTGSKYIIQHTCTRL